MTGYGGNFRISHSAEKFKKGQRKLTDEVKIFCIVINGEYSQSFR